MCFIGKETHLFILKFMEIFPWRGIVLRAHGMKSDEKLFFVKFMRFFEKKMVQVVIKKYFSLFLKNFEDFSEPKAITDSPFKSLNSKLTQPHQNQKVCWTLIQ